MINPFTSYEDTQARVKADAYGAYVSMADAATRDGYYSRDRMIARIAARHVVYAVLEAIGDDDSDTAALVRRVASIVAPDEL